MLRIRLFGNGRVLDGLSEIKLPSRAWTLPLLAYLVLHRGEALPRTRVAFALWPDEPEHVALQNLRRNLHRLQKALPAEGLIDAAALTLRLDLAGEVDLDVAAFERLRADEATLEEAVDLYQGDFLEDLADDWIDAERERLRRAYHADLNTLIVINRRRRAFGIAIRYAERLLASDPWHESAVRALMSLRYESGDAAGALAEFETFSRRLRTEMNVEPMPETVVLRVTIARGAPLDDEPPPQIEVREAAGIAPFVGRERDLERLEARWLRAAGGAGGIALIRGEAGIGKSRLAAQLALTVESGGARVIIGTTSAPEADPYQCLASALADALPLVASVALAPPFLAAVAELVPELHAYRDDIAPLARLEPDHARARLFDALAQLFVELARPRPLLVILEDLHRAGAATVEALQAIAPRLARTRALLIVTARTENVDRSHPLRDLLDDVNVPLDVLDLGPLALRDLEQLVAVTGDTSLDASGVATLLEKTQGNPLFATEFLREARRTGGSLDVVPAGIEEMITGRVSSLPSSSRIVAEVAAIAGDAFTAELVRECARLAEGDLLDAVDELLDRHLIRESIQRGRYEYAFTHQLVRGAIYDSVPPEVRTRRHRRIARILEAEITRKSTGADERTAELALHFDRGGDAERAARYYARAARRAERLYANAEARGLLDRALALGPAGGRERFDLLMLRAKLGARLIAAGVERADLDDALALAANLDDAAVCEALYAKVDFAHRRAEHESEMAAREALAARAETSGNERWRAFALSLRADYDADRGAMASALAGMLEASERFRRLGDDAETAKATMAAAYICNQVPGHTADAERLSAEAIEIATSSGDREVLASVLMTAGKLEHQRMDPARMSERFGAALAVCLEIGDRFTEVECRHKLGVADMHAGHDEEAVRQLREAVTTAEQLGLKRRAWSMYCNLGVALGFVGDSERAIACYRRAFAGARNQLSDVAYISATNIAEQAWLLGDIETMAAALDEASAIVWDVPYRHFSLGLFRGRLLRCRGEFDASLEALEACISGIESEDSTPAWLSSNDVAEAIADIALTHLARGDADAARQALQRATKWPTNDEPSVAARNHWIETCVHAAAGDAPAARRSLELAHDLNVRRLAGLTDPELRAAFEAAPVHRAIRDAFERDVWPAPGSRCIIAFPEPAPAHA